MPRREDRERAYFDRLRPGGEAREACGKYYAAARASVALFTGLLREAAPGAEALEIGCGTGSYAIWLAGCGARVTGLDLSPVRIREARERAPSAGVAFRVGNAEALDFPDASFDLVFGASILHHVDVGRAAHEVARVLRPGGRAVFLEPLGGNPLIGLYRRLTPGARTPDEHPLVRTDFEALGAHFRGMEVRPFHLLSLAAAPLRGLPGFGPLLSALDGADRVLFRAIPFTRRWAWRAVVILRDPAP